MKKGLAYIVMALLFASCGKQTPSSLPVPQGDDIVFSKAQGTKAVTESSVSNVSGFSVSAISGDGLVFSNARTKTLSAGREKVEGYYWEDKALSFYAVYPYTELKFGASVVLPVGTAAKPLTGTEDIVCASVAEVSPTTDAIPLEFDHILARFERIVFTADKDADCEFGITSLSLDYSDYGNYDFLDGHWSDTLSSVHTFGNPVQFACTDSAAVSSDFTFIPGDITLRVDYDIIHGKDTTSVAKAARLHLDGGKRTTVRCRLVDDSSPIAFVIGLVDWNTVTEDYYLSNRTGLFVEPEELLVGAGGGSYDIVVSLLGLPGSWTIESLPDWITVSVDHGSGESVITVTIAPGGPRDGEIVFSCGSYTATLTVHQGGAYVVSLDIDPLEDVGNISEVL